MIYDRTLDAETNRHLDGVPEFPHSGTDYYARPHVKLELQCRNILPGNDGKCTMPRMNGSELCLDCYLEGSK